jgi:hypothetical protein
MNRGDSRSRLAMKTFVFIAILFGSAGIHAEDAHFSYSSSFGSDGINQEGMTSQERNTRVYFEVWLDYIRARKELNAPLPTSKPGGYSQHQTGRWTMTCRYGELLETMAELQAFTTQNAGFVKERQKDELTRIDEVLRSLDLSYVSQSAQGMVDFCNDTDLDKIEQNLKPILRDTEGNLRPIPSIQNVCSIVHEAP